MPVIIHYDLVILYFVYGLAFFSMGTALTLEMGRAPRLAERRFVRPLAIFGLLHGTHEWLEIFLLQAAWLGHPFPEIITWLRVGLLAISFTPLLFFALTVLNSNGRKMHPLFYLLSAGLVLSQLWLVLNAPAAAFNLGRLDTLSRYFLAVPGALLAGLAMTRRAKDVQSEGRVQLAGCFRGAAVGFMIYGLTQVFAPPADFFPANLLNTAVFLSLFRFPIQMVRAATALLVTYHLIRAIQVVERERDSQLLSAQQARLAALEQVRRELLEREAMRAELLRHIVIAQEEERARIAREIHDETAQLLTAITLDLATLESKLHNNQGIKPTLGRLQDLSREMSQGLYRMVHDLRPAQLDDLGLVPALQHLVEFESQRRKFKIYFEVQGSRQRLDPLVETVFFRIAQEALNNVIRHAKAPCAVIRLTFAAHSVWIEIIDEGVGFDTLEQLRPPRGWGLAGMKERADSIGGNLTIQSQPGKGTRVEMAVPVLRTTELDSDQKVRDYETHSLDVSR